MNSSTTAISNKRSVSHSSELRHATAVRAAVCRILSLLLTVAVQCVLPTIAMGQVTSGSFGYSDTWASYTPSSSVGPYAVKPHPVVQAPALQAAMTPSAIGCGKTGCGEATNCGCTICPCDETCRKYAIDVSSVFFRRNRLNSRLLFFNPVATSEQIDASQFDLGSTPGIQAGLIVYNQQTHIDFEFRSIWLNEWSSGVSRNFTGGTVQIAATPPLATTGPRTALSTFDSRFWSAECNARYRLQSVPRTTLLAGFRTMRLDDELNASLVDPAGLVPDEIIQTSTRNRLFGFQIGADYLLRNSCNWCLRMKGRAGLYGNAGSQQSALISLAAPPVTFPASGDSSDLAFHAELGLEGKFRLCESANLLFGYRVMTLDGLAIATQQLGAINFLNQAGYEGNELVVMQAINIGVEFVY